MKVIFFGLGSIGQRHARLLHQGGVLELFALRTFKSDAPAPDFPVEVLSSWQEVDKIKPQVAFITNPTSLHIPIAIECARRGMSLFMEKPMGASTERLDELLELVQQKQLASYVAYVLRFHPIILQLKDMIKNETCQHMRIEAASFLPAWRPGRDYHKSYSGQQEMGGGVVFDLSHEMDYVQFLLGPITRIEGHCARRGNVTKDAEDTADMHLVAKEGFASVHLSFLSHVNQRHITIYFPVRTVLADLNSNTITEYKKNVKTNEWHLPIDREELFKRQLEFFLANLNNPHMMNNLREASGLFKQICAFKERAYAN